MAQTKVTGRPQHPLPAREGHAERSSLGQLLTQSRHCASLRYRGFLGTFASRGAKGSLTREGLAPTRT